MKIGCFLLHILCWKETNSLPLCCNRGEDEKGIDLFTGVFGFYTRMFI